MLKFLLPLIAAIKYKPVHNHGEQVGAEVAAAYLSCEKALKNPPRQEAAGSAAHS